MEGKNSTFSSVPAWLAVPCHPEANAQLTVPKGLQRTHMGNIGSQTLGLTEDKFQEVTKQSEWNPLSCYDLVLR